MDIDSMILHLYQNELNDLQKKIVEIPIAIYNQKNTCIATALVYIHDGIGIGGVNNHIITLFGISKYHKRDVLN